MILTNDDPGALLQAPFLCRLLELVSVGPGAIGVDAMIGMRNGVRTLTVRDSREEYVYTEQP